MEFINSWHSLLSASGPLPTPYFLTDESRLASNMAVFDGIQQRTGAKILLALKGYSMFSTFPLLRQTLHGACASSPHEARLAKEDFGREVHAFAAAFSDDDMREIAGFADHIVFNSFAQCERLRPIAEASGRNIEFGLRINPEHSEGAVAIYNPCSPGSRLGIRLAEFEGKSLEGISGLHFHTLCEQGAEPLDRTVAVVEEHFGHLLAGMKWVNFGGGHKITGAGYNIDLLCRCIERVRDRYGVQVYLEPGTATVLDCGVLVSTVLDVVQADMPVVIVDTSAAAHMPDVLETPYRPNIIDPHDAEACDATAFGGNSEGFAREAGEKAWTCRLAGKSCLAGDVIGEYSFAAPLKAGDRLIFLDMAHYSMVKTNTFNGLGLPDLYLTKAGTNETRLVRRFGYEDFRNRLS